MLIKALSKTAESLPVCGSLWWGPPLLPSALQEEEEIPDIVISYTSSGAFERSNIVISYIHYWPHIMWVSFMGGAWLKSKATLLDYSHSKQFCFRLIFYILANLAMWKNKVNCRCELLPVRNLCMHWMKSGEESTRMLTFNGLVSKLDHLLFQFHLIIVVVVVVVGGGIATNTLW